jgi:uncharacterized protein YciI
MFIVSITYKVELTKVDQFLGEHIEYLKEQYSQGNFILSGRKIPRTGGVIISNLNNKNELLDILAADPFKRENLADYDIIEIEPSMSSDELSYLI